MPTRNLLTVLLFTVAAASSWWLYRQVQPTEPAAPAEVAHEPDYFFEDFVVTSMDTQGQPKHRLKGTRMAHYPDDDSTQIESPELELYVDAAPAWTIIAEHGSVSSGGDQVRLEGEVRIKQHRAEEADAVSATTRDVLIRPDDEYAETDQLVVITRGTMKLQAVGMRAFLKERRVELLSKVVGVHAPE